MIATESATLVWLANLACIELHQMPVRAPHFDQPDYIVYDFDPPEGFAFRDVRASHSNSSAISKARVCAVREDDRPQRAASRHADRTEMERGEDFRSVEAGGAAVRGKPFHRADAATQKGSAQREGAAGYLSQPAIANDRGGIQPARVRRARQFRRR